MCVCVYMYVHIYIYIYIYMYIFYVPALALQATIHSRTRQKGRKDSDGRVQDVGNRSLNVYGKYRIIQWDKDTIIHNWYPRLNFIISSKPTIDNLL